MNCRTYKIVEKPRKLISSFKYLIVYESLPVTHAEVKYFTRLPDEARDPKGSLKIPAMKNKVMSYSCRKERRGEKRKENKKNALIWCTAIYTKIFFSMMSCYRLSQRLISTGRWVRGRHREHMTWKNYLFVPSIALPPRKLSFQTDVIFSPCPSEPVSGFI